MRIGVFSVLFKDLPFEQALDKHPIKDDNNTLSLPKSTLKTTRKSRSKKRLRRQDRLTASPHLNRKAPRQP